MQVFIIMNKKQITKNLISWIDKKYYPDGRQWYRNANQYCQDMADAYEIPLSKVAGVMSALSVGVQWDVNQRQCSALIAAYFHTGRIDGLTLSTYKQQIRKALDILDLPDDFCIVDIENILGRRAFKTKAFFYTLFCPFGYDCVTVDRHIFTAAGLVPKSGNKGQYEMVVSCIQELAKKYRLRPFELQAIIWLNVVKNNIPI